eukprot:COSAG01_NODE_7924_length_2990_cov_3.113110_1_plen_383_part_00
MDPPEAAAMDPRRDIIAAVFDPRPRDGGFSPVYLRDPSDGKAAGPNTAAVNAGDYRLYVGGKAINGAFSASLSAVGHRCAGRYEPLHTELLAAAMRCPGRLCWLDPDPGGSEEGSCPLLGFCGMVSPEAVQAGLLPVGLVSIAIFREGRRPCGSTRNVAMVYTVGPNCGTRMKRGQRPTLEKAMSAQQFGRVLSSLGAAIVSAARQYNHAVAAAAAAAATGPEGGMAQDGVDGGTCDGDRMRRPWRRQQLALLPPIEALRMCLVSGGVFRHPEATKFDVAAALVSGLRRGARMATAAAAAAAADDDQGPDAPEERAPDAPEERALLLLGPCPRLDLCVADTSALDMHTHAIIMLPAWWRHRVCPPAVGVSLLTFRKVTIHAD